VTSGGQLAEAGPEQPIAVLAEVGSVFFLYGHGYCLVELNDDVEASSTSSPGSPCCPGPTSREGG
jgi:hypothetical protein